MGGITRAETCEGRGSAGERAGGMGAGLDPRRPDDPREAIHSPSDMESRAGPRVGLIWVDPSEGEK